MISSLTFFRGSNFSEIGESSRWKVEKNSISGVRIGEGTTSGSRPIIMMCEANNVMQPTPGDASSFFFSFLDRRG